ncbi:tyrosine-type recombinase/integrase [Streptomyces sp. NA02950]|uniref:tyrosine-type recombinase/integrase n=1 Tax=Streptomyces sp. NA02950 TaxID=2742137 RepID=UPI0020CAFF79|nr:tyrosine-type recombinase/integrase [Streptomyces sp. NA02950]
MPEIEGTSRSWAEWIERWHSTSTLSRKVRDNNRSLLSKIGRWLAAEHPEITEPDQWTRQTCASWVAAVDKLRVGDYSQRLASHETRTGQPVTPHTKSGYLTTTRAFFRDLQEWEWIPRRFDPVRALSTPRTIAAMLGPDPRVIADDIWAKLLWPGLNIGPDDLPTRLNSLRYPFELLRVLSLTWLFSGLRSDEIARLRVGCVRWQHEGFPIPGDSDEVLARDAVCLLDVPTHKTGTSFTKPVDPLLGKAIEARQELRPQQPKMLDRKTGEHVDLLFAMRARRVAKTYVNGTIIPSLCQKAGVPTADVRGNITSHRARSTIASQLYNAKEPMTLFELQAWLGHRSPESTQHYAKITPNTLARAYNDAGYFERNVRTIEVLVDRDAVTSGAAASGEPWQYYDLGHGFCTYTSSSSAHTAWPALAATSTRRKTPARASSWRPRTTSSACWRASRSTTKNAPPSTTARPHSTSYWNGWSTSPRQLARRLARSAFRRPRHCCPSSPSTRAKTELLDKSDSTEDEATPRTPPCRHCA